jgi:trigger factor
MTLKVDVETVDPLRRRLAVEVPAEAVSAELEKAYAELGRAAKVRGFRPGRVPRHVLERMFGDRVRADVFARLIQDSYAAVIEERHIEAVGQPEIVTEQAEPGGALRYSATVEVKPEVVVEAYRSLEVERPTVIVTDVDVDRALERLRQSFAQVRPIVERSQVEWGDVVTLDYEARVDGRLVGRGEKRDVEIGANSFPPEFDRELSGARLGADLDFVVVYPTDHAAAEVAGKTVQFRVHIRGLSRKEVPVLDDEFAKDHGECATLEDLRQRVRQQLEAEAAQQADESVRRAILVELAKLHDIPVPQALVQQRTEALVDEVWQESQQQRLAPRNAAEARGQLRADLEPHAREQVKVGLLLEAIARQEGISVSDDELDQRISALAAQAGTAAERLRAVYEGQEARHRLRARMVQSRAVDVLLRHAKVKSVPRIVAAADENG